MEANAGLVAGSHNRNELVVIPAEGIHGVCILPICHPPSYPSPDFVMLGDQFSYSLPKFVSRGLWTLYSGEVCISQDCL